MHRVYEKDPHRMAPGQKSILGKLKVSEDTNSRFYLLQVCQRDTFRHLEAVFDLSALGQEENPHENASTHTR